MEIEILALASATPRHRLSQEEALALAHRICCVDERQSRLASALYKHSGVRTRYSVLPYTEAYRWAPDDAPQASAVPNGGPSTAERMAYYEEHALPLALEASRTALSESRLSPREITHLVTVSCTGFTAPGIDCGLIDQLQLRRTTQRTHIGYMGCHGAINALRVAHGLSHSDARARILVCAVELCSLHYAFHWDNERMLGNALFADGAGAMIVGARPENSSSTGSSRWRLEAAGSYLFPGTADAMTWSVGDHGFVMTISSELPRLIREHLGEWLSGWLGERGLSAQDIQSWAVHPGGPKILEAVQSAMSLSPEKIHASREVLSQYGNMSSATVLFVLKELQSRDAAPPCVMLGFGPGLVTEAMLLL